MKYLVILLLALISASATLAQVRTFTSGRQTFTIDVASTINDYYNEALNGSWDCIPAVLEYAAEKEHLSKAQYLYGMSYMQGIDRERNIDKGLLWLKKAADQGEKEAAGELGTYYDDFGLYSEAEQYLVKACSLGANYGYYNLGHHYMLLAKIDLAEKNFILAINYGPKGQVDAIRVLAVLYARQGRIKDSVSFLKIGAEKFNDPYSQGRLGEILYYWGSNCDEHPSTSDKTEGMKWLKQAADAGDERAKQILTK